jgi:hypothetical protein
MCANSSQHCAVLTNIAFLKWNTGDYCAAQVHATKAQRLAQLSANLFQQARALWTGAICSTYLGNVQQSIDQLHRGRVILGGLAKGCLDYQMAITQGEIHLLKSEYGQARNIYSQIVENSSPE